MYIDVSVHILFFKEKRKKERKVRSLTFFVVIFREKINVKKCYIVRYEYMK